MSHALGKVAASLPDRIGVDEGLLSSVSFGKLVHKERLRSDRHRLVFSIVVFRLLLRREPDREAQTSTLSAILFDRLRLTDERGLEDNGDIVALLPHTHRNGAMILADSVIKLAYEQNISITAKIYTYPESDSNIDDSDSSDSGISFGQVDFAPGPIAKYASHDLAGMDVKKASAVAIDRQRLEIGKPLDFIAAKYPTWKRTSDILLSSIGLFIASPILVLAAIAIKCSSKGPVFFLQWRTGQNSRPFRIYKLRTMVVHAEELKAKLRESNERDGPAFKMKYDPRVTRVGKFLRATGLDELPQLWNVLKGDMAIVGPRPLPCDEDASCEQWQRRRLDTKPGITCFWQIMKSRVEAFDDWMRLDLKYLAKRSFVQDVRLMLKTVIAVILGRVGH